VRWQSRALALASCCCVHHMPWRRGTHAVRSATRSTSFVFWPRARAASRPAGECYEPCRIIIALPRGAQERDGERGGSREVWAGPSLLGRGIIAPMGMCRAPGARALSSFSSLLGGRERKTGGGSKEGALHFHSHLIEICCCAPSFVFCFFFENLLLRFIMLRAQLANCDD
jgi:hypothetical protein